MENQGVQSPQTFLVKTFFLSLSLIMLCHANTCTIAVKT